MQIRSRSPTFFIIMTTDGSSSSSSSDYFLSLATILNMISVKLSPTNLFIWRNQMLPLRVYQKLNGHVMSVIVTPPKTKDVLEKWFESYPRPYLITILSFRYIY